MYKSKIIFTLSITVILSIVGITTYQKYASLKSIDSYEECVSQGGKIALIGQTPICSTRLGHQFKKSPDTQKVNQGELSSQNPNIATEKIFQYDATNNTLISQNYNYKITLDGLKYQDASSNHNPSEVSVIDDECNSFLISASPRQSPIVGNYGITLLTADQFSSLMAIKDVVTFETPNWRGEGFTFIETFKKIKNVIRNDVSWIKVNRTDNWENLVQLTYYLSQTKTHSYLIRVTTGYDCMADKNVKYVDPEVILNHFSTL